MCLREMVLIGYSSTVSIVVCFHHATAPNCYSHMAGGDIKKEPGKEGSVSPCKSGDIIGMFYCLTESEQIIHFTRNDMVIGKLLFDWGVVYTY